MLVAEASNYYHFAEWFGTVSSTNNPLPLSMSMPHTLCAIFLPNLVTNGMPECWMAKHGWTNDFMAAATNDHDGDGMPTVDEWGADTDPTNRASALEVLDVSFIDGKVIVEWKGGTGVTQYLDGTEHLLGSGSLWRTLFTNLPPTSVQTNYQHDSDTNGASFYRIRATR